MSWVVLQVLRAFDWCYNKANGYCHPFCDYSKCDAASAKGSTRVTLICPKCGRVTEA